MGLRRDKFVGFGKGWSMERGFGIGMDVAL
jgi:hypothetical protein